MLVEYMDKVELGEASADFEVSLAPNAITSQYNSAPYSVWPRVGGVSLKTEFTFL